MNNRLQELLEEDRRGEDHVELDEFLVIASACTSYRWPEIFMWWLQDIIEDIQEAGWTVKKARENDRISDRDLRHIFDKVDVNRDTYVNRMVSSAGDGVASLHVPLAGDEDGLQVLV